MNPRLYQYYRQWIAGGGPGGRPVRGLLQVASWIYGLGVLGRLGLYRVGVLRRIRLAGRVISVGNITAGGTGKTPFVMLLAQEISNRGARPAVVLRGYGGKREGSLVVVSDGERIGMDYPEVGDEALLLARKLPGVPVIMTPDRVRGCQVAFGEFEAQVAVLDDGFQHLQVKPDLNVLLLDRENPFGYGYLLPRGLLREPLGALRRADLCVITGMGGPGEPLDFPPRLRHAAAVPCLQAVYTPTVLTNVRTKETVSEQVLHNQEVIAFSGIANPAVFEQTLHSLGIIPRHHLVFPDHHRYVPSDLSRIARRMAREGATVALTTEKDAVRLEKLLPPFSIVTVAIRLTLTEGQAEFKRCLDALLP